MNLDAVKNFATVIVNTGGFSAGTTTVVLSAGNGIKLPNPSISGSFNLVCWNSTDYGLPQDDPNVEIVRCTARSTDSITIIRGQEGTVDSNHNIVGKIYKLALTLTAKMITDISTKIPIQYDAIMPVSAASIVVTVSGFNYSTQRAIPNWGLNTEAPLGALYISATSANSVTVDSNEKEDTSSASNNIILTIQTR